MTQLEKNDLPVNHYVNNKEVLKMVDSNSPPTSSSSISSNNASSSSNNCTPSTSTATSPEEVVVMNGICCNGVKEEETSEVSVNDVVAGIVTPDNQVDKESGVPPVINGVGIGPHFKSKKARLSSMSPPTPVVTNVVSAPIPLPPPNTLAIGGNAYGGNQSYLGIAESELQNRKYGNNERPSSPRTIYDYGPSGSGYSGNITNSNKMAGVVGFGNLGNTCFMNSGLQSLLNTPPVIEFFLKSPTIKDVSPSNAMLTESFQNLIKNAWHGEASIIHPRAFKEVLGNIFSQFKDCRQHDCQEFLALTLDVLHEQLKIWNSAKRGVINENENETHSSTSGPSESSASIISETTISNVNDSDVSSSLQSPAGCNNTNREVDNLVNSENYVQERTVKKRRITDDPPSSSATAPTTAPTPNSTHKSSVIKEESLPANCETHNGPTLQIDVNNDDQIDTNENDMLLDDEGDEDINNKQSALKKKAKGFWMNYIRENNTVIASSFQGMYKSTMTCSVCNFVSITFEPFMYLSLPIPTTMERTFDVMFSSSTNDYQITKVNVTLNINDNVEQLKDKVVTKVFQDIQLCVPHLGNFCVAEVVNYQIITILKDDQPLKNVKDGVHNVYVLELNQNFSDPLAVYDGENATYSSFNLNATESLRPTTYLDEDWENDVSTQVLVPPTSSIGGGFIPASDMFAAETETETETEVEVDASNFVETELRTDNTPENESEIVCKQPEESSECEEVISCSVCLEDLPKSKLKQHYGCCCILCMDCISKTAECLSFNIISETSSGSSNTKLKCPVCCEVVDYKKNFIQLDCGNDGPKKMNLIPVLFYHCPNMDSNNNSYTPLPKFIGHPLVVQLPSTIPATEFYEFIRKIVPFPDNNYAVKNASWNGKECGACVYNRSCTGCEFRKDGQISINSRNSILISYTDLSSELISSIEPPNMATCANPYSVWPTSNLYKEEPLIDIYECMDAFSQIEYLDDQNPWHCSVCEKNQCATKSLTICRFPDYLIVYLKRFVFVDQASNKLNNKLKFPIENFDVSKYIAEEFSGGEHIYDLYSCVCHFGSASGGHYTSYSKNPKFDAWHYFNDDSVSNKCPSKDEFGSGYILFYAKKGLKCDIPLKRTINSHNYNYSTVNTNDVDTNSKVSNECDTTSTITPPDCSSMEGGIFQDSVGNLDLSTNNQEDVISSTSADSDLDSNAPKFGPHKRNSNNVVSSASMSSVNCVRENVSNLCIDVNRRKRVACGSASAASSSTATSTSASGTNHFDNFDNEFEESPTIKPYAEFAENKRITKIAQRSKFSPNTQQIQPNNNTPSSSGRRKQV